MFVLSDWTVLSYGFKQPIKSFKWFALTGGSAKSANDMFILNPLNMLRRFKTGLCLRGDF